MTVLDHLKKEHELFQEMLELLEQQFADDSPRACSHVETILRAFQQSLTRHEEVERLVFAPRGDKRKHGRASRRNPGAQSRRSRDGASRRAIERGRQDREDLQDALRFVLENLDEGNYSYLKGTLASLSERLHRHFRQEEIELWPACDERQRPGKKLERGLAEQEKHISSLLEEVRL
ncbi:MAG: hypothetical protein ABIJ96_07915 [Elusimicrobiota bacterium]